MLRVEMQPTVSVVIPFFNNHKTINLALASLCHQDKSIDEIIIVDDCSVPRLRVEDLEAEMKIIVIRHEQNLGLAASYNEGIRNANSELIVLMHPDVVLPTKSELRRLLEPFHDRNVVAAGHINARLSNEYWSHLSIGARSVLGSSEHKWSQGFNGQFDCIRRSVLNEIGGFNNQRYRTAGEDGDVVRRLNKYGLIKQTTARAWHHHDFGQGTCIVPAIKKSFQYGYAQGILFKDLSVREMVRTIPVLYREVVVLVLLLLSLFSVPIMLIVVLVLLSALPTPLVILKRDKNLLQFMALIVIQVVRNFAHTAGVLNSGWRSSQK
jgi:glycosyltransferase involved in cell wall biosynthesis